MKLLMAIFLREEERVLRQKEKQKEEKDTSGRSFDARVVVPIAIGMENTQANVLFEVSILLPGWWNW